MLKYSDLNTASFFGVGMVVHGDDVTTTIKVNLSKPPFDIDFNGTLPTDFVCAGMDEGVTATASIATDINGDNILTYTYSTPPPAPSDVSSGTEGMFVQFIYSSLPLE